MPRNLFDIDDGETDLRDEEGAEFPDPEAQRLEAVGALTHIVKDRPPEEDARDYRVNVRDERGQGLYEAAIAIRGRWLPLPPSPLVHLLHNAAFSMPSAARQSLVRRSTVFHPEHRQSDSRTRANTSENDMALIRILDPISGQTLIIDTDRPCGRGSST